MRWNKYQERIIYAVTFNPNRFKQGSQLIEYWDRDTNETRYYEALNGLIDKGLIKKDDKGMFFIPSNIINATWAGFDLSPNSQKLISLIVTQPLTRAAANKHKTEFLKQLKHADDYMGMWKIAENTSTMSDKKNNSSTWKWLKRSFKKD